MFEIRKRFEFSAAHRLEHMEEGHKCRNLHGHNYEVEVVLGRRELDDEGFVRDYGSLWPVRTWIDEKLDHGVLVGEDDEDLRAFCERVGSRHFVVPGHSTAELLAVMIFHRFVRTIPEIVAVRVSETGKTWAEYRV